MTPFVHGRLYPETESSELLGCTLRILIDPRIIADAMRTILDLDTLRIYLRDINSPCTIALLLPAQGGNDQDGPYKFMRTIGVEEFVSASIIADAAAAAFPDLDGNSDVLKLASTASFSDADIVVSNDLASRADMANEFKKLDIALVGADGVREICEVFARGHEVPWSFRMPAWSMPWGPFYPMVDADIQAMENFRALATRKGVSADTLERIRSLALNRWSAIAYTRDKLLFYMIQRRRARRHKLQMQDFTFELSYSLTTYFFLFWGCLDQIAWIVNDICGLAFKESKWREVGVQKKKFVSRLKDRDPEMLAILNEPEFLRWMDVLRRARHYVAHQGTAMLSPLIEKPEHESPVADVDRQVEQSAEWRRLAEWCPPAMMETFRPVMRAKWYRKTYRQLSDAAFVLQGSTDTAIIFPLDNIEWDYERFRSVMRAVAKRCITILEARSDTVA